MVKFKDFSRPLSVFQVLFKANLLSMTFQDNPVYSRTFQACANPVYGSVVQYLIFFHKNRNSNALAFIMRHLIGCQKYDLLSEIV